jgi:hypothetical protein
MKQGGRGGYDKRLEGQNHPDGVMVQY